MPPLPVHFQQWPGHPRYGPGAAIACVSSFGFGGTNACAVLDEPPEFEPAEEDEAATEQTFLLPLSASGRTALDSLVSSHRDFLKTGDGDASSRAGAGLAGPSLRDLCYTRRTHHEDRLAIAARSREELVEAIEAFQRGETRPGMSSGRKSAGRRRKVAFVFSGRGAQWLGMGRGLMAKESVFREELEKCDHVMRNEVVWSLLDRLRSDDEASDLRRVEVVQPVPSRQAL